MRVCPIIINALFSLVSLKTEHVEMTFEQILPMYDKEESLLDLT